MKEAEFIDKSNKLHQLYLKMIDVVFGKKEGGHTIAETLLIIGVSALHLESLIKAVMSCDEYDKDMMEGIDKILLRTLGDVMPEKGVET